MLSKKHNRYNMRGFTKFSLRGLSINLYQYQYVIVIGFVNINWCNLFCPALVALNRFSKTCLKNTLPNQYKVDVHQLNFVINVAFKIAIKGASFCRIYITIVSVTLIYKFADTPNRKHYFTSILL